MADSRVYGNSFILYMNPVLASIRCAFQVCMKLSPASLPTSQLFTARHTKIPHFQFIRFNAAELVNRMLCICSLSGTRGSTTHFRIASSRLKLFHTNEFYFDFVSMVFGIFGYIAQGVLSPLAVPQSFRMMGGLLTKDREFSERNIS